MRTRRGFLQAILAAGVAPAVVGSGVLMPVRKIIDPYEGLSARMAQNLTASIRHAGLMVGDMITITGMTNPDGALTMFKVNAISSGVVTLQAG